MAKKKKPKGHTGSIPESGKISNKKRRNQRVEKPSKAELKSSPSWIAALKEYKTGFFLVLLLAFIPRMLHFLEVVDTPFFKRLHADPNMYYDWALRIIEGDWLSKADPVFYLGPLYPYFLSFIYSIAGPSTSAAVFVQVVLSTVSAALIYHLAHRLFGPLSGLAAGVMAAFYSMFIFYSSLLLGATLIIFLNLVMLTMIVSGLGKSVWWKWALAGVCMGLSACARGNVLLYSPFAALAVALYFGIKQWKLWVMPVLLMAFFSLTAIMPVTLHNLLIGDDFVLLTANGGSNFFIGNNASSDGIYMRNATYKGRPMGLSVRDQKANFPVVAKQELGLSEIQPSQVSSFWVGKTIEGINADVAGWISLLGNKSKYYFNQYEVPNNRNIYFSKQFAWILQQPLVTFGFVVPFALLGMFLVRKNFKNHAALFLFFIAHFIALLMFFVNARYRLIVAPILLVYSGAALGWIIEKLRTGDYLRLAAAGLALLFVFSFAYVKVPRFSYRANYTSLGNAYSKFGDQDKALENYDKAIAASRSYYYAYFKKGQLLARLNRNAEAEKTYRQALSLAKRDNNSLYVRRITGKLRQLQKAMQ